MIKGCFKFNNKDAIVLLYSSLIRPILEYGAVIWHPYLRKDILNIEYVQKRFTKLIPQVNHLPYQNRLKLLKLFSFYIEEGEVI